MAEYFDGNNGVSEKLRSAEWGFERRNGELYGCITVQTAGPLTEEEEQDLKEWISGQNSDGLGEGFEQREVARYKEENEEWVEDDEDEDGGYYETNDVDYYVYGQFWWRDAKHPYKIELVNSPGNESKYLQDIKDAPYSSSFIKDRATLTINGREYVKIGPD